jgi:hypothetical protein
MDKKRAIKIAMFCIEQQQAKFVVGHRAFEQTGSVFGFAKRDHDNWQKLEQAKQELARMLETREQLELFATTPLPDPGAGEGVGAGKISLTEAKNG